MSSVLKMQINPLSPGRSKRGETHVGFYLLLISIISFLFINTGCTASRYRMDADKTAQNILREKQEQLFGRATGLNIERPRTNLKRSHTGRKMIIQVEGHPQETA